MDGLDKSLLGKDMLTLPEAAMLARHANPRVTVAVYAGLTDGAREVAVDKLLNAGFGA